jgi:hypothetical protein
MSNRYTMMDAQQRANHIAARPETSYWLRDALNALMRRDPVDAAHDARLLAAIMEQRANEITGVIL